MSDRRPTPEEAARRALAALVELARAVADGQGLGHDEPIPVGPYQSISSCHVCARNSGVQ